MALLLGGYRGQSRPPELPSLSELRPILGRAASTARGGPLDPPHTPGSESIVLDRRPRRARSSCSPAILTRVVAPLGFALPAWTGGPTRPIIPPEARSANLLPIAEEPQGAGVDVGGAPGLVDIDLPDVEAVPRDSGRVKVIGEPGLCFEVLDLATGESVLEGEIRGDRTPTSARHSAQVNTL